MNRSGKQYRLTWLPIIKKVCHIWDEYQTKGTQNPEFTKFMSKIHYSTKSITRIRRLIMMLKVHGEDSLSALFTIANSFKNIDEFLKLSNNKTKHVRKLFNKKFDIQKFIINKNQKLQQKKAQDVDSSGN